MELEAPTTEDPLEKSWQKVRSLIETFQANRQHYLSDAYQEANVRQDFIDNLFIALGWDVRHEEQQDPYRQEVRIEKTQKKAKGRADYAFSITPYYKRVRFFVEAKRPQTNIATPDNCFQAIRYSWPKALPITILTDFNSFHIIDSRFRPRIDSVTSRIVRSWHYTDLKVLETFAELYYLFSRDAVASGSIQNFADNELPIPQTATRQYSLFAGEMKEFDDDFLNQMDEWRESLAVAFKQASAALTGDQLTECVQRTLDRLIFIRFLEDKSIEPKSIISKFGENESSAWKDFVEECKKLDQSYNGIVFKQHSIIDGSDFGPVDASFTDICDELTDDHSPYNFDSIPVEILGRIYERFLGKIIFVEDDNVEVIEKATVRKAGGVYYTPDYIVAYMVDQSLHAQLADKKPEEIAKHKSY